MALKIITDSASDLPKQIIDEYQVTVIPTPVVINEKDYFDGETIFPKEFYDILRKGTEVRTYHINSYMFYQHFEPFAKAHDEVIYLCFSTGIAGTFNAANVARRELLDTYPDFDLTILDTKCASIGFGVVTYLALLMQKNGASKQEIIDGIVFHCAHMEHLFTVETLFYLVKGGRISKVAGYAGGILDIKPIIVVDEIGALKATEKVRGRRHSLKRLVDMVGERGVDLEDQVVGFVHGDCEEEMNEVMEEVKERYHVTRCMTNFVGCAIGAHTGPGIIGIVFLNAKSPYQKYFLKDSEELAEHTTKQ